MTIREALALWRKEQQTRLAAEVIETVLSAAAAQEDATARLADLAVQITSAERSLASVRAKAEEENRALDRRHAEVRAAIARAETDAATRAEAAERELATTLSTLRENAEAELETATRGLKAEVASLTAERDNAQRTLGQIRAQIEQFRRELAPLVGKGR